MSLKNCPVCDSNRIREFEEAPARHIPSTNEWWFTDFITYCIECEECGHRVEELSWRAARDAWEADNGNVLEHRLWKLHLNGRRK